ncbi:MarR family transcriptional regulator [Humibacter antri]
MAALQTPDDPWTEFVMRVFEVHAAIIRAGEEIAAPLGQSSARWQVLGRAFEGVTVAELARDIGHARQSVQRLTNALVADRLVKYAPHPSDRRTQIVRLTDRGQEVLEQIYERQLKWSQAVVENLGPTGLTEATGALRSIAAGLHALASVERKEAP